MTNRYTYSVPFTEAELFNDYVTAGMTQKEIAAKYGTSQKVTWLAMKKAGIVSRAAAPRNQWREANNNWKGGRTLQPATGKRPSFLDQGYWQVYRPEHPHAMKNGYAYEHVIVALEAASLQRLPPKHCVHHINLRKQDNDLTNLAICDHRTHQLYHRQLEVLAVKLLLDTGIIKFQSGVGYVEA